MSPLPLKTLGRTGIQTTTLGIGGYLGLLVDDDDPHRAIDAASAAVQRATELGVRYFDTSPAYGGGVAEKHLGAGLASLDPTLRQQLTISTKVGTHPQRLNHYLLDDVRWCYDQSRHLLGDIDIVFVHDPGSDDDMDTIMRPGGAFEFLEGLREQGEIRGIGLGNRTHRWLRRVIDSGRADLILPSYDYHPIRQSVIRLLEHAAAADVGVVNGSPYLGGLLAGIDVEEAARHRSPGDVDFERARQIYAWCQMQGVEVGAIAVQYSLRQPLIGATLVGPRTAKEVEDNVRHATAEIGEQVWEELDRFIATLQPPPAAGGEAQ
ncbi:MAG: aldo/keto reductase [Candidatus Latescibacteria bacterium]|nr:aldo/keto reductase [Candidatus Latescibacterota bacterium]